MIAVVAQGSYFGDLLVRPAVAAQLRLFTAPRDREVPLVGIHRMGSQGDKHLKMRRVWRRKGTLASVCTMCSALTARRVAVPGAIELLLPRMHAVQGAQWGLQVIADLCGCYSIAFGADIRMSAAVQCATSIVMYSMSLSATP
jgi:hypothetical protein